MIQILALPFSLSAQDSVKKISISQVMQIVKEYHPVAKQATIIIEKAAADLTIARSGFDPLLNAGTGEKT
ncbi:MAG: transporter, partial [Chitinophagaceae bacterium]|nr:transporter [Chitinophagaceae bacterium]